MDIKIDGNVDALARTFGAVAQAVVSSAILSLKHDEPTIERAISDVREAASHALLSTAGSIEPEDKVSIRIIVDDEDGADEDDED